MARLGCLGSIFMGLVAQIYLSTAYESGSLCMYQAMTFYENFGLEVAYKIIKRKLGSRVYIFTNLTQEWDDQKRLQDYDQTFMLIIGRTEKMYNLFEKLEEVNFQTGLLAEQIIDGNKPYLDWASEYIPPYNANETTSAENMSLSDTNEAFTFCENFINKKYGLLPPNHTIFADVDIELNSNHTSKRMPKDVEPYQDLLKQTQKGEKLPPDATIPGLEMEKDDNLQAMDEEEASIKEKQRLIREQQMIEAKRKFDMQQGRYYERNEPQMYERDHPMPNYYERNDPRMFYERDIPGNYKQNAPGGLHERGMPGYYQRNVPPEFYQRNPPVDYERNALPQYDYYRRHIPVEYAQNAPPEYYRGYPPNAPREFYQRYAPPNYYGRNAPPEYYRRFAVTPSPDCGQNVPPEFYQRDIQENYEQNAARGFNQRGMATNHAQNVQGVSSAKNTPRKSQNLRKNKDTRGSNTSGKPSKNGQCSDQATQKTAARRRSFMEAIHNFIFSDKTDKEETNANEAEVGRRGRKIRKRMRAREFTETYQPYEKVDEMDQNEIDEMENPQPDTVKHYIYVQHVDNRNAANDQAPRNERKSARASQGSRARKNEKPSARVRKTVRPNARKAYGMNQGENVGADMKYNYKCEEPNNYQKNEPVFNYKSNNVYDNLMAVQKDNAGINNYHVPGDHIIRPQNEQKAIQQIDKLPAVHVNQFNMRGDRPMSNPNNLPVLHEMHAQAIPNLGVAMKNPPINNFEKIKQSRKVKSAPRVRKSRAKAMKKSARPRPVAVKKSKMVTSAPQYHMDLDGHSTLQVIDVLHYDYEPRQNMMMLQ
ncbi:uncharacterized protein LOC135839756 [Planococcus citri]|uniref:uncharacterized protein LOC135839756 n=1 Tax=Planococcus citri TaxID=170843 RepID=UPI0031F78B84